MIGSSKGHYSNFRATAWILVSLISTNHSSAFPSLSRYLNVCLSNEDSSLSSPRSFPLKNHRILRYVKLWPQQTKSKSPPISLRKLRQSPMMQRRMSRSPRRPPLRGRDLRQLILPSWRYGSLIMIRSSWVSCFFFFIGFDGYGVIIAQLGPIQLWFICFCIDD